MNEKYKLVKEILNKYNQKHLLSNYNKLDDEKKEIFLTEIMQIDFEMLSNLYKKSLEKEIKQNKKIEPIEYIEKDKLDTEEKEKYEKIGTKIISNGGYAVVTMAGGQRDKAWT